MSQLTKLAVLLAIAVSGCNKPPVATASSHPPAIDLVCPPEPAALTDEQVLTDHDGVLDRAFNDSVLLAGRACRDALARACGWHVERGMTGVRCQSE